MTNYFYIKLIFLILRMKEKFNSHINLKNYVEFVEKVVSLFDLLVEYRNLNPDCSDELKGFYLNEILVKKIKISEKKIFIRLLY